MKIVVVRRRRLIDPKRVRHLVENGDQVSGLHQAAPDPAGLAAVAGGDTADGLPTRTTPVRSPPGIASRAALVDRAECLRGALVRVRESGAGAASGSWAAVQAWHRAQICAQDYLHAYQAAVDELDRRDRLARRVATQWLEAAITALWYRVAEADAAEALARDYLYRLPLHSCPRTAAREVARAHQYAIGRWLAEHRDELCYRRSRVAHPARTTSGGSGARRR